MSEATQLTTPSRWLLRFARKLSWPFWVIGLVILVVTAFYVVENWRGARRFAQVKKALEAKGEQLDWVAFIPPAFLT